MLKKIAGTAMGALLCVSLFTGAVPHTASAPQSAKAVSQADETADDGAYLFVHFIDDDNHIGANSEQMYFSVSKDGTTWKTINSAQPVLQAKDIPGGDGGVRDPHIIRSPEGNKFYMIATDLSIYNTFQRGHDWGYIQSSGSQNIVIWESDDLVNWSEPRLRKVGRDNAGCVWAPESIWDKEKNAYMVFWASRSTSPDGDWKHRIYRSYTTDFDEFTEPEVYIESDDSRIDTTFIEENGVYYRFTKNEGGSAKYVYMEKSDSLSGDFEIVSTYTLDGQPYDAPGHLAFEGPTIYKLNGQEKWCLLLDSYEYRPFVTDDLTKGRFVSASEFNFGGIIFRHGTVLPITRAEYNAIIDQWEGGEDLFEEDVTEGELVYSLDFEENLNAGEDGTLQTAATPNGNLTYVDGVNGGKAVQLSKNNGGAYVTLPNEALLGYQSATISFATNVKDDNASWLFYAAPSNDAPSWPNEKYLGIGWHLDGYNGIRVQRFNNSGARSDTNDAPIPGKNQWVHVTAVFHVNSTELYINGEWTGEISSAVSIRKLLQLYKNNDSKNPVIYLGKAMWEGGEYSSASMDCFKIHNYAMSEDKVWELYQSDMGVTEEKTEPELIYSLNIGTDNVTTGSGTGTATAQGSGLAYATDPYGHNAVTFSDGNSITLSDLGLEGLTEFSVTFAMKGAPGTVGGDKSSWLFFLTTDNSDTVYNSEKYLGICWQPADNGRVRAERYYGGRSGSNALQSHVAEGEWAYVTVVYRAGSTSLYINGQLALREASSVALSNLLKSSTIIQLGKANWKTDGKYEYANASISCFEIYSGALSDSEVNGLYQNYIGA